MNVDDVLKEKRRIREAIAALKRERMQIEEQCEHVYTDGSSAVRHLGFGDDMPYPWCQGCEKYETEIRIKCKK